MIKFEQGFLVCSSFFQSFFFLFDINVFFPRLSTFYCLFCIKESSGRMAAVAK